MKEYKKMEPEALVKIMQSNHEVMGMIRTVAANALVHHAILAGDKPGSSKLNYAIHQIMTGEMDDSSYVVGILSGFISLLKENDFFRSLFELTLSIKKEDSFVERIRREAMQEAAKQVDPVSTMFVEMLRKEGLKIHDIPGFGLAIEATPSAEGKIESILAKLAAMDSRKPN